METMQMVLNPYTFQPQLILTSCSAYKNIREKHYSNSQLPHILANISKQHIFNYLSELNFFNKL